VQLSKLDDIKLSKRNLLIVQEDTQINQCELGTDVTRTRWLAGSRQTLPHIGYNSERRADVK